MFSLLIDLQPLFIMRFSSEWNACHFLFASFGTLSHSFTRGFQSSIDPLAFMTFRAYVLFLKDKVAGPRPLGHKEIDGLLVPPGKA